MKEDNTTANSMDREEDLLFKPLDELQIPEPSVQLKDSFAQKLDQYSSSYIPITVERRTNLYIKVATIAAIFIFGWFIGSLNTRNDKLTLKQLQYQLDQNNNLLVLTLLQQSSVSDRLQATNVSYSISNLNEQVLSALINSLENDSDPNVRIKCAEALAMHLKSDTACKVFERALSYQNDPYMQLMLINLISSINTPESKAILTKYLKSNNTDEFVRSEIRKSLTL